MSFGGLDMPLETFHEYFVMLWGMELLVCSRCSPLTLTVDFLTSLAFGQTWNN